MSDYPSKPAFRAVRFISRDYNLSSESVSGRKQVRHLGGQRFEFSAKYPPMKRTAFMPVIAFITSQRGQRGTFTITLPVLSFSNGTATGTMLSNGGGSIGDSTIAVDGFTGVLPAGSLIKFNGHTKAYMTTADRSGAGTLSFTPPLVESVSNNEAIVYNGVELTVRLKNDVQEFDLGLGRIFSYEVDFEEAT